MATKAGRVHMSDLKQGKTVHVVTAEGDILAAVVEVFKKDLKTANYYVREAPPYVLVLRSVTPEHGDIYDTLHLNAMQMPYANVGRKGIPVFHNIFVNRRAAVRFVRRLDQTDPWNTVIEHPVVRYFHTGVAYYPFAPKTQSYDRKWELKKLKRRNKNLKKGEFIVAGVKCDRNTPKEKVKYLMEQSANELKELYPHKIEPLDLSRAMPALPENIAPECAFEEMSSVGDPHIANDRPPVESNPYAMLDDPTRSDDEMVTIAMPGDYADGSSIQAQVVRLGDLRKSMKEIQDAMIKGVADAQKSMQTPPEKLDQPTRKPQVGDVMMHIDGENPHDVLYTQEDVDNWEKKNGN